MSPLLFPRTAFLPWHAGHPRAPATGASEQSEATPRNASDRKASEAKPQIKPHASPGLPGDPWRPLGGQERSDVGAQ